MFKKILLASVAMLMTTTPTIARDHHRHGWNSHSRHYDHHRYDRHRHRDRGSNAGTAIAAGALGLVIGSMVASSQNRQQTQYRECWDEVYYQNGEQWIRTLCRR